MSWQLRIDDPSGKTRILPLKGETTLGRGEDSAIVLKDLSLPPNAAVLMTQNSSQAFWLKVHDSAPAGFIGDLSIREAQIPLNVPFRLGETRMKIETKGETLTIPEAPPGIRPWLTKSEEGKRILWTIKKVAPTSLSVYLEGETGVGKEILSQLIHSWSDRKKGPFVAINCGALPVSLAESELFGHVKGAFTGAVSQRPGALMQAHGGTLLLDEIGDLPLDIQVKLLRFLENGEVRAVGSDHQSRSDVRLICATHHPLKKLIEEGKFRRDLFYRVASVSVSIPALRTRPEDIELLSRRFCQDLGKLLSPQALLRIQAHNWPGNVRELRHAIERASGLSTPFQVLLGEEAFEFLLTPEHISERPELELGSPVLSLAEMERVVLLRALRLTQGNRAKAAKILGVARSTLFEMLKRHKVPGIRVRAEKVPSLM